MDEQEASERRNRFDFCIVSLADSFIFIIFWLYILFIWLLHFVYYFVVFGVSGMGMMVADIYMKLMLKLMT